MALATELMGLGAAAPLAAAIGSGAQATGLTATGSSSQSGSYALTSSFSVFTTVSSNNGARLPNAAGQPIFVVVNGGSSALLLYPATGENINGGSANSSFSVTNAKQAICYPAGNGWAVILSA